MVDYVAADTPAARDGVSAGDTILSINGRDNPTWLQVMEESALASNKTVPPHLFAPGQDGANHPDHASYGRRRRTKRHDAPRTWACFPANNPSPSPCAK